jgi:hypothetical protein
VLARSRGFLIIMLLVAGCAAPKPILYPNAHLQQGGEEVVNRDTAGSGKTIVARWEFNGPHI